MATNRKSQRGRVEANRSEAAALTREEKASLLGSTGRAVGYGVKPGSDSVLEAGRDKIRGNRPLEELTIAERRALLESSGRWVGYGVVPGSDRVLESARAKILVVADISKEDYGHALDPDRIVAASRTAGAQAMPSLRGN